MIKTLVILLTGFGPFQGVPENTSGRIIHELKRSIEQLCGEDKFTSSMVLRVTPGVLATVPLEDKEVILSFGVHPNTEIRLERGARNTYLGTSIDPNRPFGEVTWGSFVPTTLEGTLEGFRVQLGNESSAGDYVCNDTYYRAIQTGKRAYFIHIPTVQPSSDQRLIKALSEISCTLLDG